MLRNYRHIYCFHRYFSLLNVERNAVGYLCTPERNIFQNKSFDCMKSENILSLNQAYAARGTVRYKSHKKGSKQQEYDSSDEEEEDTLEEGIDDNGRRVRTVKAKTLRTDNIMVICFGLSRRRTEEAILGNKFKINGKGGKKSADVKIGDEIELYATSTDGDVTNKCVKRIIIKNIKPMLESSCYYVTFATDQI